MSSNWNGSLSQVVDEVRSLQPSPSYKLIYIFFRDHIIEFVEDLGTSNLDNSSWEGLRKRLYIMSHLCLLPRLFSIMPVLFGVLHDSINKSLESWGSVPQTQREQHVVSLMNSIGDHLQAMDSDPSEYFQEYFPYLGKSSRTIMKNIGIILSNAAADI